jgi:hypothetical protein
MWKGRVDFDGGGSGPVEEVEEVEEISVGREQRVSDPLS